MGGKVIVRSRDPYFLIPLLSTVPAQIIADEALTSSPRNGRGSYHLQGLWDWDTL